WQRPHGRGAGRAGGAGEAVHRDGAVVADTGEEVAGGGEGDGVDEVSRAGHGGDAGGGGGVGHVPQGELVVAGGAGQQVAVGGERDVSLVEGIGWLAGL